MFERSSIIERMQQCAAIMIERTALESVGGAGLLWSVAMFEHSTDCTCLQLWTHTIYSSDFQIFYSPIVNFLS
jgi:hypothetical protein